MQDGLYASIYGKYILKASTARTESSWLLAINYCANLAITTMESIVKTSNHC